MSEYFSLEELVRSRTAVSGSIDNTPSLKIISALTCLARDLLDPIRELWGGPVIVNSGFRSPALNAAVGGSPHSQHMSGEAADITTGTKEGNKKLFGLIAASDLVFDRLIDEKDYSWLHVSYKAVGNNRRNILHL